MSAPERRNVPLLHLQRPNGTLWFGIDDCIPKDLVATTGKRRVYGLGSIQDIDDEPSETAPASLFTHVAVDGCLTIVEGVVTCLKDDVSGLKEDVIGIKRGIEVLMKMNGVDPVTFEPIQRDSDASVPTPQSSQ
ncbi:unnamed protein product [Brassica oleracea var. botrytis]|nr:unnamed protein product [Brassica napus]CDY48590.1 BnaCnng16490D [Brassica napus]